MKILKIGKLINSISNTKNCLFLPLTNCCQKVASNNTNNQESNIQKLSFKEQLKLIYYTFFFNEENDSLMAIETMLQPFIGIMNTFIRCFGKLFVVLVWVLCINMANVFYSFIIPEIWRQENFIVFMINLVLGTWLTINTFFHYV